MFFLFYVSGNWNYDIDTLGFVQSTLNIKLGFLVRAPSQIGFVTFCVVIFVTLDAQVSREVRRQLKWFAWRNTLINPCTSLRSGHECPKLVVCSLLRCIHDFCNVLCVFIITTYILVLNPCDAIILVKLMLNNNVQYIC